MYSTLLPLCTGTLGRYKYSLLCMDYPFSTHYSQLPGDTVLLSFSKKDLTFHKGVRSCNTHLSVPGLSNIIIFSITLVTNYSIWLIFVAKYLWHISNPFTSWWILVLFCYFCFFSTISAMKLCACIQPVLPTWGEQRTGTTNWKPSYSVQRDSVSKNKQPNNQVPRVERIS